MKRVIGITIVLVIAAAICGALLWGARRVRPQLNYDCNAHPPVETFTRYFGPPPSGISDIHATGHISIGGADVWLRFRATKKAVSLLMRGYNRLKSEEARKEADYLSEQVANAPSLQDQQNQSAEHKVHWNEIKNIRDPQVYVKPQQTAGTEDVLVIDSRRQLVYYYHWNQ